jgi:hypothetical protein
VQPIMLLQVGWAFVGLLVAILAIN